MSDLLCAIPVRSFGAGKVRLSEVIPPRQRTALVRASAERVIRACRSAGASVVVVSGSDEVADWASRRGVGAIAEPEGTGLDGAAGVAAEHALERGLAYAIVHADLPLLTSDDIVVVGTELQHGRAVLAPSRDGGTSVLAARAPVRFQYGPRSFRRHLAAAAHLDPQIVVRRGLCIDLDRPSDIRGAMTLGAGSWITSIIGDLAPPAADPDRGTPPPS